MKKILTNTLVVVLCFMMLIAPTAVFATEGQNESEGYDLFGQLWDNIANAHVDEDDLARVNEELTGDPNFNPLNTAKSSLSKVFAAFAGKDYDKNDFGGKADEVYGAISDAGQEVTNSGILDSIWNFGTSVFNLIVNWISSIGEAFR